MKKEREFTEKLKVYIEEKVFYEVKTTRNRTYKGKDTKFSMECSFGSFGVFDNKEDAQKAADLLINERN